MTFSSPLLRRLINLAGLILLAWVLYQLTWDLRPYPIYAPVDDWKYVKDALNIAAGDWLGAYNQETLTKRPLFSLALAITYWLSIPFTVFIYGFHFLTSVALAYAFRRVGFSTLFCWFLLIASLFMPHCFDGESMRVIRDFFFASLQNLILAAALYFLSLKPGVDSRRKRGLAFVSLCFLTAWYFGTREEYMFLWPLLGLLMAFHLHTRKDLRAPQKLRYGALLLAIGVTFITTTGFLIRYLNYRNYGVFLMIEHEEGSFPKMIGRIASVNAGPSTSKLLIDWEERESLAAVSPKFRPLHETLSQPLFDTSAKCLVEHKCDPFDFSHQIYAIRAALPSIGCPANGRGSELCYRAMIAEMERVCFEKLISCEHPPRSSMLPPLGRHLWGDFAKFLAFNSMLVIRFDHRGMERRFARDKSPEILAKFDELTRQPHFIIADGQVHGPAPAPAATIAAQDSRRSQLVPFYRVLGAILGILAFLSLGFLTARTLRARRIVPSLELTLGCGLFALISLRILLISYIGAADNFMGKVYATPAYHPYLILCLICIVSAARAALASRLFFRVSGRLRFSK